MARSLELDRKSRSELVEEARGLGLERPERLTRVELVDEIIRRTTPTSEQAEARGLFGVARSMLASVVESGLNLPEAASKIRGNVTPNVPVGSQAPVATVTLAEIYAAQGHKARALRMLEEVLRSEPDHQEALRVKKELAGPVQPDDEEQESSGSSSIAPANGSTTSDYVPSGFVETTGEEIQTGQPPSVTTAPPVDPEPMKNQFESNAESQPLPAVSDEGTEMVDSQPALGSERIPEEESSGVMEKPNEFDDASASFGERTERTSETVVSDSVDTTAPSLVMRRRGDGLQLYWELPERVLDHCGVDRSEGQPCLRVVMIVPAGAHPKRHEHTLFLDQGVRFSGESGQVTLDESGPTAAMRAALGWLAGDSFLPICVGKTWEQVSTDEQMGELAARIRLHWSG